MTRNFLRLLDAALTDDVSGWTLEPDGTWMRKRAAAGAISSQERFIRESRREAVSIGNYEETIESVERVQKRARRRNPSSTARQRLT